MIKAIIFDSDDTILDFSKVACPVIKETALRQGLSVPEDDEVNSLWGIPLTLFLKTLWHDVDVYKFKKLYYSLIKKQSFEEIEGAKEVICLLYRDYSLGVLTTKPRHLMYHNFQEAGFDLSLFKFAFAAEDSGFRKPDPRVFDRSIEILNLKPENILYIGDSIYDYQAARDAKINFVAVTTGFYKREDFIKEGLKPKYILMSIKDLPAWLEAGQYN